MAVVVAFLVLCLGAPVLGWWLGGRKSSVWVPCAVTALAVTGGHAVISSRPDWMVQWYPHRDFALIDGVWFAPFVLTFLGIAVRRLATHQRVLRGAVLGCLAAVVALAVGSGGWVVSGSPVATRHIVDHDGVVRQTTSYTCAAAASATLCRRLHVPVTEAEMASAMQVVPYRGTTMVRVYWAMRDVLGDRVRSVQLLHAPELAKGRVPTPCLADLRYGFGLNHCVLVREVRDDDVIIEDPETGIDRMPIAQARRLWSGNIVSVELRTPIPPLRAQHFTRGVGLLLAPRGPVRDDPHRSR